MSDVSSKPREWWIDTFDKEVYSEKEIALEEGYSPVHVIEKRALDEALSRIAELEKEVQHIKLSGP